MIEIHEIDDYAAEYVLGTLDRDERIEVAVLRASNLLMDTAVIAWEKRLSPLDQLAPEATPSSELLFKIESRISVLEARMPGSMQTYARKRWRVLAFATVLLLVMVGSELYLRTPSAPQLVAALQTEAAKPMFIVRLDQKTATLSVHTQMAAAPSGKDYELWLIPAGEKTPRPVGVLTRTDMKLPMIAGLAMSSVTNATLAISIEPLGGSPTGSPTGPVIVTGKLAESSL